MVYALAMLVFGIPTAPVGGLLPAQFDRQVVLVSGSGHGREELGNDVDRVFSDVGEAAVIQQDAMEEQCAWTTGGRGPTQSCESNIHQSHGRVPLLLDVEMLLQAFAGGTDGNHSHKSTGMGMGIGRWSCNGLAGGRRQQRSTGYVGQSAALYARRFVGREL